MDIIDDDENFTLENEVKQMVRKQQAKIKLEKQLLSWDSKLEQQISPLKLPPAIRHRHKSIDVSPMLASLVENENKMIRQRAESLVYSKVDYQRSV